MSTTKTIAELKLEKARLEEQIRQMLVDFSVEYGVSVLEFKVIRTVLPSTAGRPSALGLAPAKIKISIDED